MLDSVVESGPRRKRVMYKLLSTAQREDFFYDGFEGVPTIEFLEWFEQELQPQAETWLLDHVAVRLLRPSDISAFADLFAERIWCAEPCELSEKQSLSGKTETFTPRVTPPAHLLNQLYGAPPCLYSSQQVST